MIKAQLDIPFIISNNNTKLRPDSHLGLFEEAQEAKLFWPEDQEGVASAVDASGCSAHSVDVLLRMQS